MKHSYYLRSRNKDLSEEEFFQKERIPTKEEMEEDEQLLLTDSG